MKRQDLAQSPAFVHSEAFNAISGYADADQEEGASIEEKQAVISAADILAFVKEHRKEENEALTHELATQLIQDFDEDKDGTLDPAEFS